MYRGSTNWESWAIHAWISNVEHSYWHWKERADAVFEEAEGDAEVAMRNLAVELEQEFTNPQNIVGGRSALASDVTEAELETVDWNDVADNVLSEANYDGIEYSHETAK